MTVSTVTVRGVAGALYWGYYLAGTVKAWTATRSATNPHGTITATIVTLDAYRATQRPMMFVVSHQHGSWRWPIVDLQIAEGGMTAQLGPPQE